MGACRTTSGCPAPARRFTPLIVVAVLLGLTVPVALAAPAEAATCPCTIFAASDVPDTPADSDTDAVEVGVKFRADVAGTVTAIRFYKGAGNSGTHVGRLWSSTGTEIASATFVNETATGWQEVAFSAPVSISAGTTYVASYYAPVGRYSVDNDAFATAGVDNAPLHALANGVDGGNGVYRYGAGGGFPTSSFRSSNYWVDVVFSPSGPDTTPPAVTATTPAAGATGVGTAAPVSATFSEAVQAATVAMQLTGPGGAAVAGSTGYDSANRRASFTPSAALASSTTYTARVSGAQDAAGNTMAQYSWSFTTGASGSACPCTIFDTTVPATPSNSDASAVELGVKFRSSTAGYVTGLRFYKGSANTGTHVGSLWSASGVLLSSATFQNETATGWQTVVLPSPIQITANTTYVASYHAPSGRYAVANNALTSAVTRGPLTALANSTSANGVYRYGGGGVFPTDSFQSSNYYVDVVFDSTGADTTPPTVTSRNPAPNATGVATSTSVLAAFSEPVTSVAMGLTGPSGAVAGTVTYDSASRAATFTPTTPLAAGTQFTASVSGAKDAANNTMAPVSWSFTTAAAAGPPLDAGPGGPILVVKNPGSSDSQFTSFTAEVLRAEGLNEFTTVNLASVTPAVLSSYDVVVLGRTPLTADQVTMFSTWVNGGGNLVAFRPAAGLASLLGLTSAGSTLSEGYLKADTTQAPGAGITDQTIQWHGVADRWNLSGARAVATLYSNATTATTNPAVSLVSVGSNGGQAAAFTFDLPQSLVYSRQGNPAWEGQERDGVTPVRSDDQFYGGSSTDWVNLTKVAIPQADEQQRLFANLIGSMNLDRKPLPRFWYLPRGLKAAVVSTGDDHAYGGTAARFEQYAAASPAGCSVAEWQCLRKTSYIYPNSPLTNAQAAAYTAQGFEIGLHPQNNCANYTASSLASTYASQLASWQQRYSSIPAPSTNRFHCMVWTDWVGQPTAELQNGMRLDTNYYYWPGGSTADGTYPNWIQNRPGFMTGSGMPMRFAGKTGSLVDVYQATTQLTDESNQTYPFTVNTLLDNALGPLGYYGVFTANLHTNFDNSTEDNALISSAQSRGVPLITSKQMLTWLDGRNSSSFSAISSAANTLSFGVTQASGANGLTGMVPTVRADGGTLTGITRGGSAVSYTTQTIKGVSYAFFTATSGSYVATYGSAAGGAPGVAAVAADSDGSGASSVSATTAAPATTQVVFGRTATSLTSRASSGVVETEHEVRLPSLAPGKYYYRVVATAPGGARTVSPAESQPPATLVVPARDTRAPAVSAAAAAGAADGTATIDWRTDEPADSLVEYGTASGALRKVAGDDTPSASHRLLLTDLEPGTRYWYRIASTDTAGNVTRTAVRSFVTPRNGVVDTDETSLRLGRADGVTVRRDADGEVALPAQSGSEFQQVQMPSSMAAAAVAQGGSWQIRGGRLEIDGATVRLKDAVAAGALSFAATFDLASGQAVGWGSADPAGGSAVIATRAGRLVATSTWGGRTTTTALPSALAGASHDFRVTRGSGSVTFSVDGAVVARHAFGAGPLVVAATDDAVDGAGLAVDWLRLGARSGPGTFTSRVLDAGQMVTWGAVSWKAATPAGTGLTVKVRTGSTARPDGSWSAWRTVRDGQAAGGASRYVQYQLVLTGRSGATPVVSSVQVENSGSPVEDEGESR